MSGRFSVAGSLLADRYRLQSVLGKGAMGAVYHAVDEKLRQPCAVKLLHGLVDEKDAQYGRFTTEAAAITQLFHPNIVQVREFGQDKNGLPFLVMELLRGRDLYSLLQERGSLTLMQTLDILRQVGSALHCAHSQGIIHRDIKPKNIFLSRQTNAYGDDFEVVKVVDFGLSKFIGRKAREETQQGTILGTPEYLSPEMTMGTSSTIDYRSDQWALGVVAYRMLSGRLPFDCNDLVDLMVAIRDRPPIPLARLVPDLPAHVDAAIRRALSKRKEDRFATVQDFVRALDGLPSAHCAMQPAAPSAAAPTLMLPQVAMPGTVLSLPEPVIYDISKRLRAAVASRPAIVPAAAISHSDGVPKVEVATEPTQPRPLSAPRTRQPPPALSPWRVAAVLALGVGLSVFGSLSAHRVLRGAPPLSAPVPVVASEPASAVATAPAAHIAIPPLPAAVGVSPAPSSPPKTAAPSPLRSPAPSKRGKDSVRATRGPRAEARIASTVEPSPLASPAGVAPTSLPLTTAALDSVKLSADAAPPCPPRISMVD